MNGTQILKENITYIINTLKTSIHQTEANKKILHIFNSKFNLDNKKIENLPIGLFGDFYSQELSFILLRSSDLKNLNNIFDKCNLKIRKILLKIFINGAMISDDFKECDTFFYLKCKSDTSKFFTLKVFFKIRARFQFWKKYYNSRYIKNNFFKKRYSQNNFKRN